MIRKVRGRLALSKTERQITVASSKIIEAGDDEKCLELLRGQFAEQSVDCKTAVQVHIKLRPQCNYHICFFYIMSPLSGIVIWWTFLIKQCLLLGLILCKLCVPFVCVRIRPAVCVTLAGVRVPDPLLELEDVHGDLRGHWRPGAATGGAQGAGLLRVQDHTAPAAGRLGRLQVCRQGELDTLSGPITESLVTVCYCGDSYTYSRWTKIGTMSTQKCRKDKARETFREEFQKDERQRER